LLLVVLTTIITVAVTFIIQSYLNRPKIKGRIFEVIRAEWRYKQPDANGMLINKENSVFWVYVYLTNYHENSLHILDYKCEVDFGEGFVRLKRVYGDFSKYLPPILTVKLSKYEGRREVQIKNIGQHMLYKNPEPIQFGSFIHGLVMFAGDLSLHTKEIKKIRFSCLDVFKKEHVLNATYKEFVGLDPLLEILEVVG
jgi:hypothetical protein